MQKIRKDFDSIAPFESENWNGNNHYHDLMLKNLPQNPQNILEIGCGIGKFSRRLAERSKIITAIDLSSKMIETAENLSKSCTNINFQIADILEIDLPDEQFDAIISIATFHHLPLEKILPKLKKALKTGGKLLILDLTRIENINDFVVGSVAFPLSKILIFFHNGFNFPTKQEREAWENHAKTDHYLSFTEAKQIYSSYFENVTVQRLFFFRYLVIWEKI